MLLTLDILSARKSGISKRQSQNELKTQTQAGNSCDLFKKPSKKQDELPLNCSAAFLDHQPQVKPNVPDICPQFTVDASCFLQYRWYLDPSSSTFFHQKMVQFFAFTFFFVTPHHGVVRLGFFLRSKTSAMHNLPESIFQVRKSSICQFQGGSTFRDMRPLPPSFVGKNMQPFVSPRILMPASSPWWGKPSKIAE